MKRIKIGCDPAFRKDGFCLAIADEENELRFITFKKFMHFISWVQNDMPAGARVAIENSYLQDVSFDMRGTKPVVAKKSRNVGMNMAVSEIAYQLFTEYAHSVRNISPKQKGAKWKNDSTVLRLISQYNFKVTKRRFSQDERDAFKMLCMI